MSEEKRKAHEISGAGEIEFHGKTICLRPIGLRGDFKCDTFTMDDISIARYESEHVFLEYGFHLKKGMGHLVVSIHNNSSHLFKGELLRILEPTRYIALPNRNGQVIRDPSRNLPEEVVNMSYPGTLSMPWVDVDGLCVFCEDPDRTTVDVLLGREGAVASLGLGKRLYLKRGGKARFSLLLIPHENVDDLLPSLSRAYDMVEREVVSKPRLPRWVRDRDGMVQVPVKDGQGNLVASYEDIVDLASIYQEFIGEDLIIHAFGWNGSKKRFHTQNPEGAHDDNYPYYRANKSLGGRKALKKAIKKLHDMGIKVSLYTNGRIANQELLSVPLTEFGLDEDATLASSMVLNHKGDALWEEYNRRKFALLCAKSSTWRKLFRENIEQIAKLGADLVELDQIGFQETEPCFNPLHNHHGDEWGTNYHGMLKEMKKSLKRCKRTIVPWIEGIVDCYQDVVGAYQPVNLFMEQKPTFWEKSHKKYREAEEFNYGLISYDGHMEILPFVNVLFPHLLCFQGSISVPDYGWRKESDFDTFLTTLKSKLAKSGMVPGILDFGGGPFQLLYNFADIKPGEKSMARQIIEFHEKNRDDSRLLKLKRLLQGFTALRKPFLDVLVRPDKYKVLEWTPQLKLAQFKKGKRSLYVAANFTDDKARVRAGDLSFQLKSIHDNRFGWFKIRQES